MAGWSEGYFTDVQYTGHFYPQMAPAYLAFACLRQGTRPPPLGEGSVYLELGCGQGYGLNLLAAANPTMRFIGVDFHPGQIANAIELATAAGLSNVGFEDLSFGQLLALPEGRLPKCDVIALHGVWAWVGPQQRAEIVQILDRLLKPGGLAFVSYNAMPGWAPLIAVQRFVRDYVARRGGDPLVEVVAALRALLKMIEDGALIARGSPTLKVTIESQLAQPPAYLVHEYLHSASTPFFHAEVAEALDGARLSYAGTANIAEDLLNLAAPPEMRPDLMAADPVWRETLLDYASDKRFRRDIFVRGRNPLSAAERDEALAAVRFSLLRAREGLNFNFPIPLGKMTGDPEVYGPIADALAEGPKSYAELAALPALSQAHPRVFYQAIAMLVAGRRIHPVTDAAAPDEGAQAFNRAVVSRISRNPAPGDLASPVVGTGVAAEFADLLGLSAAGAGEKDAAKTATRGAEMLVRSGSQLKTAGGMLSDPAAIEAALTEQLKAFGKTRLPFFRSLGVI